MITRRDRLFLSAGVVVAVSWLALAFIDPDPPGGETVALGHLIGSLFAHATLAAAWAAFGPGPLIWRVPLSLVWVTMLPVAIGINIGLHRGPGDAAIVLGACLLGQWLLLQLPLWGLVLVFGVELRHVDAVQGQLDSGQLQFGIRQLLVVTAVVGVVLGIGRVALGSLPRLPQSGELPIFVFLAGAAIVLTLPLLLAALMRRMAALGVLLSLVLIGFATAWELPLLESVHRGRGGGPHMGHFIAINAFSAALILVVAVVVRANGYHLYRMQPADPLAP